MVVRRFRREGWVFPRRIHHGIGKGDMHWGEIDTSRVLQILHNPRYAGAFVYGRTRTGRKADLTETQIKVAQSEWQVLIREAHAGYIDWEEFERNQITLRQSSTGFGFDGRGARPREGVGLLQGRVLCGICGKRMRVRYQTVNAKTLEPYYVCQDLAAHEAHKACQSIRGREVDAAIGSLLLETVSPAALEVALAVETEIAGRVEEAQSLRLKQLERQRYLAELARRRYMNVDPANRMVADALEADWNAALRQLDTLQQEHDRQRQVDRELLCDEARKRIRALAGDFPSVWNNPRLEAVERKRMLGLLLEDVTLVKADKISIHVRFRGGRTTTLTIDKPKPLAVIKKTLAEVVLKIDEWLETCSDQEVAEKLNALGYHNWKGEPFTPKKVLSIRTAYRLKSRYRRLRERGMLTASELGKQIGACTESVYHWGRTGVLREHYYGDGHRCLFEPLGNLVLVKGQGGRYKPTQPSLINPQSTTQGAI